MFVPIQSYNKSQCLGQNFNFKKVKILQKIKIYKIVNKREDK